MIEFIIGLILGACYGYVQGRADKKKLSHAKKTGKQRPLQMVLQGNRGRANRLHRK